MVEAAYTTVHLDELVPAVLRDAIIELAEVDYAELLDVVGAEVESQTRRRLTAEKADPDGNPWPDLDPAYAARRHNPRHDDILVNHGRMLDAVTHNVLGSNTVEIGSSASYGVYHQKGRRPFLGLSQDNEQQLERVLSDFLEDTVAGAFQ